MQDTNVYRPMKKDKDSFDFECINKKILTNDEHDKSTKTTRTKGEKNLTSSLSFIDLTNQVIISSRKGLFRIGQVYGM